MYLYLDLFSGISGDMFCGALLHLGVPFDYLKGELDKLQLDGYEITYKIKNINGISCGNFDVCLNKTDHRGHHHNSLSEIVSIIENSAINERAKNYAKKIFSVLGEAEAKVHNTDIEKLHFHEVGAVDSIIDIVSAGICLDYLNIDKIYFGDIPSFKGEIKCAHGIIPLPGPAVCELLKNYKWNSLFEDGELITPTGASVLSALGEQKNIFGIMKKTGYGCGTRETERGNYLRAFLFEEEKQEDEVLCTEFNIDDMSPEYQEALMQELFRAGALDVMIFSGMMKKNRLGILVKVLCRAEAFDSIKRAVFYNSTTIGIRYSAWQRVTLDRKSLVKQTPLGECEYKETFFEGVLVNSKPEYESVKKLAEKNNITVKECLKKL